jgi:chromosomal replication initiation ATPase DnaA
LKQVVGSTILGNADFVKEIKKRFIEGKAVNRDLPALKALSSKPVAEDIIKAVESAFIQQPALSKNISLYLCHKYTTSRLKEIGRYFNIGESAVSQTSRRIHIKINQDKKLK